MIVSWDWLKQYVPLEMSADTLAERLMMAGLNHESTTEVDGDIAIDLEVTSNRPDCLGHLGIAREVSVLFNRPLTFPSITFQESSRPIEEVTQVTIDSSAKGWCPSYRARVIEGVRVGPSPAWMQRRLKSLGMRPVNNVVDITNYVLMECGQPLHTFDFDKLEGRQIIVRDAKAGEKILAINGDTYELKPGMGVIADAKRPVAIAGVMGGKDTEVSERTTTLLLESAEFMPVPIRRTGRALDLRSESSYRFERKIDPAGVAWASDRACHLLQEIAGGKVLKGAIQRGNPHVASPSISLRFDRIERILGLTIPPELAREILTKLGCKVDEREPGPFCFAVPPTWRRDLTREIDLIEEIGRIHGYEQVSQERVIPLTLAPDSSERRVTDKIRQVLLGSGFFESMTFSFTDADSVNRIRPWTTAEPITLQHSSRKNENKLRQSLLPSLLDAVRLNESRGNENVRLFEAASIYLPSKGDGLPNEPRALGLAAMADIRPLRGVMDALFHRLGLQPQFELAPIPGLAVGQSAEYQLAGERVAVIGVVADATRQSLDLRTPTVVAELLLPPLIANAKLQTSVTPLPDRPSIIRDLAIVLDESIPWRQLESIVRGSAGPLLESLAFVDLYRGKQIEAGKKSIAFRMTFRAEGRTLTHEEVDAPVANVVSAVGKELKGTLRA